MRTVFLYSLPDYQEDIAAAQDLIAQDYVHPLYAMSDEFGKPIEDCQLGFTNKSFRVQISQKENIVDRFLFPEPTALLGLCLYLQVHPADLIPEEFRDIPSPRSVVQVCKMIATDIRFPEIDREKADDFLDREIEVCFRLADKDRTLWEVMMGLDTLAEQDSHEYAEL